MPLPKNWKPFFYDEDTGGDLIFDYGERFIDLIEERGDGCFLVAGACFDLFHNGHKDLAKKLIAEAKTRWPDAPWEQIEDLVIKVGPILGRADEADLQISNAMNQAFGGGFEVYLI